MSAPETVAAPPRHRRAPVEFLAFAMLAVVIGAILYWALRGGDPPLWRTAIGYDGLVAWLRSGGLDARNFHGGAFLERKGIGLRILPLFDGDLSRYRTVPADRDELLREADAVDIAGPVVDRKIALLPTLVILPKWRTGTALTGVAHPALLRDPTDNPVNRDQIPAGGGRVVQLSVPFAEYPAKDGLRARLYMPQVIRGSSCEPVVGTRADLILGWCNVGHGYWLLSDPDLLNSHGLRLGDNAEIARTVLGRLARGRPIIVDYSTFVWTIADTPGGSKAEPPRSWSDLARFFAPPLTYAWIAFATLAALVLWRASVRGGPVQRRFDDGMRAAKEVSIAAKARLLRLTGHDDALLKAHVAVRLQAIASDLLGPHHRGAGEPLDTICNLVGRRDPALGRRLREAATDAAALPQAAPTADAVRRLDRFEHAIDQVLHDFGRSSRPR